MRAQRRQLGWKNDLGLKCQLKEAAAATDPEEANNLYQEAEKMLAENPPTIPLWTTSTPFAWSNKVANVKLTPFGTIDLQSVSVK